jgi:ABC-type uncharacterized transport system permease subunit
MVMACHCEGRGWRFWGESNVKSKFWGQTIQLDPVGVLTLEFDDGEIFKWSKVKFYRPLADCLTFTYFQIPLELLLVRCDILIGANLF